MIQSLKSIYRQIKSYFSDHPYDINHPLAHLNMGMIQQCTMIIHKEEKQKWLREGWVEFPKYRAGRYYPDGNQTVFLGKPVSLNEIQIESLIGIEVTGYAPRLGTYGDGGPGFWGLILDRGKSYHEHLVFAVWGADEYIILDNRVIGTTYHTKEYNPWYEEQTYLETGSTQLDDVLVHASIKDIDLTATTCVITLLKDSQLHKLELHQNDTRLPPMGINNPRKNAFDNGVIADYIVLKPTDAVLWIS